MSADSTEDIAAAWGRVMVAAGGRKTKGATVKSRAEAEKPPVLPTDGRRERATGRTLQLNMKVKPAFRDDLVALADKHQIGLAEMLERVLTEWRQLGGKGAANAYEKKGPTGA
jgi:hypothetical protein